MLDDAAKYPKPIDDPGLGKDIRSYADRLVNLGLIQLLDPGQPFNDMLWDYFFTMVKYPNWYSEDNPFNNEDLTISHFLWALSLIYDWFYDTLSATERKEVRTLLFNIASRQLDIYYLRNYEVLDWKHFGSVTNNHHWINNGAVASVAFVLKDEISESKREPLVKRTENNLKNILTALEPDGTSNEGVAYHSYGQINLFKWLDIRDHEFGQNTAKTNPWFENSVLFDLYSILPGGDDNYAGVANFGDCITHNYQKPRTIQSWLANRLDNGLAQWSATKLDWPGTSAMSLLWFNPAISLKEPSSLPPWKLFSFKGIFTWRSSWLNNATYFSLKSGAYYGGHEQPDAGQFILHRNGVPYITDLGYSYLKKTDEHNVIIIDDTSQYGADNTWMGAVDPEHWATATEILADGDYFDIMADPGPMLKSEKLSSWKREVVALDSDVFFIRDKVEATSQVTINWLLHSYKSEPPASILYTYTYMDNRVENPFQTVDSRHYIIIPQDNTTPLHVTDVSYSQWDGLIEKSFFVPELKPDRSYNEDKTPFQVGYRLNRSIEATRAGSLVGLTFGDNINITSLSNSDAEGAEVLDGKKSIAKIIWPADSSKQLKDFNGLTVKAQMAGRTWMGDKSAIFGRGLSDFIMDNTVFIHADTPVDIYTKLEHKWTSNSPGYILAVAYEPTTLTIYCTTKPDNMTIDGKTAAFDFDNNILTIKITKGRHRINLT